MATWSMIAATTTIYKTTVSKQMWTWINPTTQDNNNTQQDTHNPSASREETLPTGQNLT